MSAAGESCRSIRSPSIGQPTETCSARRPRRNVQAALLAAVVFPPPAPRAFRLAGADRAGAGGAADRGEAIRVRGIARHGVGVGEARHRLAGPIEEGTELEEAAAGIGGDEDDLAAMSRLVGAQPGDSAGGAGQRAVWSGRSKYENPALSQPLSGAANGWATFNPWFVTILPNYGSHSRLDKEERCRTTLPA